MHKKLKKNNVVVSIGAGQLQIPFLKILRSEGYRVICTDKSNYAPGRKLCDDFLCCDASDFTAITKFITPYRTQIIRILAFTTGQPQITAAYLSKKLDLPTIPVKSLQFCTDKFKFYSFLKKEGLYHAPFFVVSSLEKARTILQSLNFPVFLKPNIPNGGGGGRGILKINNLKELQKKFNFVQSLSSDSQVLITGIMGGVELQIALILSQNKFAFFTVGKNILLNQFLPIPLGSSQGKMIFSRQSEQNIRRRISNMLKKLQITTGIIALEAYFEKNGALNIFDIDFFYKDPITLNKHISNYNLENNIVKALLGDSPVKKAAYKKAAALMHFWLPKKFLLRTKYLSRLFANMPNVQVDFTQSSTNNIKVQNKSLWRFGDLIVTANSQDQAIKLITDLYRKHILPLK